MEDQSSMQPCRKTIKLYLFFAQCNEFSFTRSASHNALYGHSTIGAYLFLWPCWNFLNELWQIKWSQNLIYPTGFLFWAFWIIWKWNRTFYSIVMALPGFQVKWKKKRKSNKWGKIHNRFFQGTHISGLKSSATYWLFAQKG